jgi:hypothetical protein
MGCEELEHLVAGVQTCQSAPTNGEVKIARSGPPRRLYEPLWAFPNRTIRA